MSGQARASRRGLPSAVGVAAPSDRRFRRSDIRPDRRRRLGRTVGKVLGWLVPGALVLLLLGWVTSRVLASSFLDVRYLSVSGNQRISTGEIEALISDMRGQNIFEVDFEEYRRRVLDSPWVASVTLGRVLPATIDLHVVEREPMAIARLGHQLYLVDNTGIIIDEYGAQYREFDLPIVDGLLSAPAKDGPLVHEDRVRLADGVLSSLRHRPDLFERLSQIDVGNPRDAVVMFDDEVVWLHLGDGHFVERLNRYLELAPRFRERFPEMDYVDLRFDERVFVRGRGREAGLASARRSDEFTYGVTVE